jgi:hypothetical protein
MAAPGQKVVIGAFQQGSGSGLEQKYRHKLKMSTFLCLGDKTYFSRKFFV